MRTIGIDELFDVVEVAREADSVRARDARLEAARAAGQAQRQGFADQRAAAEAEKLAEIDRRKRMQRNRRRSERRSGTHSMVLHRWIAYGLIRAVAPPRGPIAYDLAPDEQDCFELLLEGRRLCIGSGEREVPRLLLEIRRAWDEPRHDEVLAVTSGPRAQWVTHAEAAHLVRTEPAVVLIPRGEQTWER